MTRTLLYRVPLMDSHKFFSRGQEARSNKLDLLGAFPYADQVVGQEFRAIISRNDNIEHVEGIISDVQYRKGYIIFYQESEAKPLAAVSCKREKNPWSLTDGGHLAVSGVRRFLVIRTLDQGTNEPQREA